MERQGPRRKRGIARLGVAAVIRALVTGTLYDKPQARTSASGKPFTTAKLRADGKDGAKVLTLV